MKKLSIKKLFSLIMGFALALVAVVTFTVHDKNLTAQAEETELPDTSTWEEVDAVPGDALIGTWYRVYYTEDYVINHLNLKMLNVSNISFDTVYADGQYTEDTIPSDVKVGNISIYTDYNKQIMVENGGDITEYLLYNFTDEYLDICFYSTFELAMSPKYSSSLQTTINRKITLKSDATLSVVYNNLKKLVEPTDDGTTTPDDGTTTPDDGTTTPDDGTTTPDDGTEEPKQDATDKFSNWLNSTFGLNTTGSIVGSVALLLAGILILKSIFGKK